MVALAGQPARWLAANPKPVKQRSRPEGRLLSDPEDQLVAQFVFGDSERKRPAGPPAITRRSPLSQIAPHTEPAWTGRCQILALDGGGLRGMFSVAVLAGLEDDLGSACIDHVDLIAGTSTGGLIALALGAGLSAREILDFYISEGPKIFSNRSRWRSLRHFLRSKYSPDPLSAAVRRQLGERTLLDSTRGW